MNSNKSGGHGEKFDRLREATALAVLTSPTLKKAAEKVGIDPSTLRRWFQDPFFQQTYEEAKADLLEAGTTELLELKFKAIRVLSEEMDDVSQPRIRHDAAKAGLAACQREQQRVDSEIRFNALQKKTGRKESSLTFEDILDLLLRAKKEEDGEATDNEGGAASCAQMSAGERDDEEPAFGAASDIAMHELLSGSGDESEKCEEATVRQTPPDSRVEGERVGTDEQVSPTEASAGENRPIVERKSLFSEEPTERQIPSDSRVDGTRQGPGERDGGHERQSGGSPDEKVFVGFNKQGGAIHLREKKTPAPEA